MIGILGGGLTGLSIANFLGRDCEILEREAECGGLCRSFKKGAYTYDIGGHIIFSKDEGILDIMTGLLGRNVERYYRNNKIWYKSRFIKYPFENGLSALDKEEIFECLHSYLRNDYPPPNNFKEWIYHNFGRGMAEKYLVPYNEKLWKLPLDEISTSWVDRIPRPPLEDIIKSSVGIETEGYLHQLYFYYPVSGGIQSLVKALQEKAPAIVKNFDIREITKLQGKWLVSNGLTEKYYDRIVSTMPLPSLTDALEDVPEAVKKAASGLKYNSLILVMLGIDKPLPADKFAVYFPQRGLIFHRVCFYQYFGENYVPHGKALAVAEITSDRNDRWWGVDEGSLINEVASGLEREGFLSGKDVSTTDVRRIEHVYVVPDLHYPQNLKVVREYLEGLGILLCGRFGEFEYQNMDACIRRAGELSNNPLNHA